MEWMEWTRSEERQRTLQCSVTETTQSCLSCLGASMAAVPCPQSILIPQSCVPRTSSAFGSQMLPSLRSLTSQVPFPRLMETGVGLPCAATLSELPPLPPPPSQEVFFFGKLLGIFLTHCSPSIDHQPRGEPMSNACCCAQWLLVSAVSIPVECIREGSQARLSCACSRF